MQGKTVIITGASSGIGEACAYAFANEGAKLVLVARNKDKLKQIEQKLIHLGVDVLIVPCDVKNEASCKHLIETTIAYFGKIDVQSSPGNGAEFIISLNYQLPAAINK